MDKEIYNEVRCNFLDQDGWWDVDAWKTDRPNEEGRVVARIKDSTAEVVFYVKEAQNSPLVRGAIEDRRKKILQKMPDYAARHYSCR